MGNGRTGKGLPPRRQRALNRSAGTTGFTPVSRKAAPAAKRAIAEKNIAGGETGRNGVQAGRISAEQAYRQPERQKKFHKPQNFACILFYLLLYIGSNGEMAEWSNAVDSKSIVLFTGYPGFESLSLRQFD